MRLTHLTEAKLPKLNGLSVMSLDQFVKDEQDDKLDEFKTPGRDPWGGDDGPGDDPYGQPKPEYYSRSSSYFEQFEADHFDKEDFDEKTGVFKGYWDYDGKLKQIAYFKFDNPKKAGGDDPGMGWYYEPVDESTITEIKKGQKDSNGYTKCWPGKHAEGTKKGKNGGQVRNCVPNESVAESILNEVGGNYLYHATGGLKSILQSGAINAALGPQDVTKAQTKLPTVSVTRDWGYASGSNAESQVGGVSRGAVIVLDRNAVEQRYKTLGTSQSKETRGQAFPDAGNLKRGQIARSYDIDKSGTLTKADADAVFAQGTITSFGKPASRQEVGQQLGQAKQDYYRPKAGGEFEEAVVVPKGSLPIQGNMIGFWVNPKSSLMNDPEIMNHPLRLERSKNQFVKATQKNVEEAGFGLGSKFRKFGDDEMQDYLGRVKDKEKLKTDKYKMPFVHGSNIEIKNEEGKKYDTDKLKAAIMQRPAKLLKQNEKMEHSDGSTSIFFNVGLPALKGLAVNEETGDFVIVDTCPGAGACQTYCYAMKGGYVQWKASSMAQTRVLNFLLNDPEGFKKMMEHELGQAERKYGNKGTKVVVRWHDAGDFFSSEYLDVAYSIAQNFPDIDFYAYTKMGGIANAPRPSNFKMNFSQGAKRGEEKQVHFHKTKHSRVVPRDMFYDLIAREGSTLQKDSKGRMQFRGPGELDEFKDRLADKYGIDKKSIITYDRMMGTKDDGNQRWNVIVMPGDGDDSANRNDVLGTYLLFH